MTWHAAAGGTHLHDFRVVLVLYEVCRVLADVHDSLPHFRFRECLQPDSSSLFGMHPMLCSCSAATGCPAALQLQSMPAAVRPPDTPLLQVGWQLRACTPGRGRRCSLASVEAVAGSSRPQVCPVFSLRSSIASGLLISPSAKRLSSGLQRRHLGLPSHARLAPNTSKRSSAGTCVKAVISPPAPLGSPALLRQAPPGAVPPRCSAATGRPWRWCPQHVQPAAVGQSSPGRPPTFPLGASCIHSHVHGSDAPMSPASLVSQSPPE